MSLHVDIWEVSERRQALAEPRAGLSVLPLERQQELITVDRAALDEVFAEPHLFEAILDHLDAVFRVLEVLGDDAIGR